MIDRNSAFPTQNWFYSSKKPKQKQNKTKEEQFLNSDNGNFVTCLLIKTNWLAYYVCCLLR